MFAPSIAVAERRRFTVVHDTSWCFQVDKTCLKGIQKVPFQMLHQLLNITATAEQCFRLIQRRQVGLVEINTYDHTCSLAQRDVLLSTRTCMCQHNVFRLVPNTKDAISAMTLLGHGYMYTYALRYDTRYNIHAQH